MVLVAGALGCAGSQPPYDARQPLTPRQRDAALKALLGPERFSEYVSITDTVEAAAWLHRFWIEHDPTPTTPENEFQIEHERRVRHAIYLFGGTGPGGRPWDDRGEVYIRYGQPDERVIRRSGIDEDFPPNVPQDDFFPSRRGAQSATELWTFYRWNETFQFADKRGLDFFVLVPVTDPEAVRQDLGEFHATRLRAIDLQPAIYYHEYGKNLIDYALDVVRFHGEGDNWRVDVNLGYPLSELGRDADSVSISLRRTLLVRDEQGREVFGEEGHVHRVVGGVEEPNRLMVEQKILDLPSGAYTLAVTIDDLCSGKTGTLVKTFRLPRYVVPEVQEISDVEIASYVWTIFEPGSPFVKEGQMVVPLPSRIYLRDQPLAFYFEVYNLLIDADGHTQYEIAYEITGADGKSRHAFAGPGLLSGTTRRAPCSATLDIADLPGGDYILTVTVNDRVGQHARSTVGRFRKSD